MTDALGIYTVNPASYEPISFHEFISEAQLDDTINSVHAGFTRWRHSDVAERVRRIQRLSDALADKRPAFAEQIVREMGKPIGQALAEIDKCIDACAYYADRLPDLLAPREIDVAPDAASVHLRPLGVVLAILPWNYPWWQVIRAMLPVIAVGNTVLLKHAESVTGCAKTIERVFRDTFDDDVLRTIVLPGHRVRHAIEHPGVVAVTFTGSERVGALVAENAGRVLKKCVLELGGSDPFIVLEDADIEAAAEAAARSRFLNNGQSCIAAKRLFVHQSRRDDFVDAIRPHIASLTVGDPFEAGTDVGPLAREDLLSTLIDQRNRAEDAGARLLAGASAPTSAGAWFAPAILEIDGPSSPLFSEETFGPLGAMTTFTNEGEAVELSNDSQYGLSSSIWSKDTDRARSIAALLDAGSAFVNSISMSDPRLPVGGVKASGYGRELAEYGIAEFANVQAVRVAGLDD